MEPNDIQDDHEAEIAERIEGIRSLNLTTDELLHRLAQSESWSEFIETQYEKLDALMQLYDDDLGAAHEQIKRRFADMHAVIEATERKKKENAANAANALHSKEGGNRDKRKAIQNAWATGKFTSRARCAEQEADAIGMSYSTAIKALQNTPDPDPWPAKASQSRLSAA